MQRMITYQYGKLTEGKFIEEKWKKSSIGNLGGTVKIEQGDKRREKEGEASGKRMCE